VEHHRANGDIWTVQGQFKKISKHWLAPRRYIGLDHACGYLQRLSEPENSDSGVLARGFTTYAVGIRVG
jgi:hypothetical protein